MIRTNLEYAAVVWLPHKKKDIRQLERIQREGTKMLPKLQDLDYEKRLKDIELITFQDRRELEDLIIIYKLINWIEKDLVP